MKKLLILLMSTMLLFPAAAQDETPIMLQGEAVQKNYHTVIPYDDSSGLPVITVEMKGEKYRFLVDTGASTSIKKSLSDLFDLRQIGSHSVGDSGGNSDPLNICIMPDITVGNVVFSGVAAYVINDDMMFMECFGWDGIIESNQLRKSIIRFSSKDKTITLTNDLRDVGLNEKKEYICELFLEPFQSFPCVWFKIEDKVEATIQPGFDSGMVGVFDLALRHFYEFREHGVFSDSSISQSLGSVSYGIHGKAVDTIQYRFRVPGLWVNNKTMVKNVTMNTTNSENSRFGMGLLKYGDVTIDYKNKGFLFDPHERDSLDYYEKDEPISLNMDNNKLIIGVVWDKTLSNEISAGDQVLAINGFDLGNLDKCQLFTFNYKDIMKETYIFKLKDKDGNIKEIEIKR